MRQNSAIPVFSLLIVLTHIACFSSAANGQTAAPVSLQEQLSAQYKLAKMSGAVVTDAGTPLAVQKGGVISVPWRALVLCPAKFQDNALHPSTGMCAAMVKDVSGYFKTGDKVYPTKIEVNLQKAKISFSVVSCDSCNGVDPPTSMKGQVVFQFPKGYLEKADAGTVENAIGQVFSIGNDTQAQSNQPQGQQEQAQRGQAQQDQPAQQEQAQPDPQTIQLGQSTDEVQAALGKPEKIVNLGPKQLYVYKDLKITFVNGKVSDVQ
jgi:hypothetical protein